MGYYIEMYGVPVLSFSFGIIASIALIIYGMFTPLILSILFVFLPAFIIIADDKDAVYECRSLKDRHNPVSMLSNKFTQITLFLGMGGFVSSILLAVWSTPFRNTLSYSGRELFVTNVFETVLVAVAVQVIVTLLVSVFVFKVCISWYGTRKLAPHYS